jgi:hypothetical protein
MENVIKIVKFTAKAPEFCIYGISMSTSYGFVVQLGQVKSIRIEVEGLRERCSSG